MITDKDAAQVCVDTYDVSAKWDHQWSEFGVYLYARILGDVLVLAFRGSTTPGDWLRDFFAIPLYTKSLGTVHAGFYRGLPDAYMEVLDLIKQYTGKTVVTGHSLGAAEALILAGLMIKNEYNPLAVITFGCPRPGFYALSEMLACSGVPIRCYRNGDDPVPLVPHLIPEWIKPVQDTLIYTPPDPNDHEPLHCHHMPLYLAGTPARPVDSRGAWAL